MISDHQVRYGIPYDHRDIAFPVPNCGFGNNSMLSDPINFDVRFRTHLTTRKCYTINFLITRIFYIQCFLAYASLPPSFLIQHNLDHLQTYVNDTENKENPWQQSKVQFNISSQFVSSIADTLTADILT